MKTAKISGSSPKTYAAVYDKLRGVDFSTDPGMIAQERSPWAPNLVSGPGGYPEKRPGWRSGVDYVTGQRVLHGGVLYKALQDHTSQDDWTPDAAPSLFAKVLIPDAETIPEWEQPDSTNPYSKGDKVTHNGKMWVSTIDNNVWEPGVYGWEIT